MSGCFGNHWIDRHLESELMRHLDEEMAFYCEKCGHECSIEDCDYDDETDKTQCPVCKEWQDL